MEYNSATKTNEIMLCSNMDGPRKVSKTETNITWYHSYVESNLKNDTNELIYRIVTYSQISKIN